MGFVRFQDGGLSGKLGCGQMRHFPDCWYFRIIDHGNNGQAQTGKLAKVTGLATIAGVQ